MRFIRNIAVFVFLGLAVCLYGQENNFWNYLNLPSNEEGLLTQYVLSFNNSPPSVDAFNYEYPGPDVRSRLHSRADASGNMLFWIINDSIHTSFNTVEFRKSSAKHLSPCYEEFVHFNESDSSILIVHSDRYDSGATNTMNYRKYNLTKLKVVNGRVTKVSESTFGDKKYDYFVYGDSDGNGYQTLNPLIGYYYSDLNVIWLHIAGDSTHLICLDPANFSILQEITLDEKLYYSTNTKVVFNNNGTQIAFNTQIDPKNVFGTTNYIRHGQGNYIFAYDFNPNSGLLSNKNVLNYPTEFGLVDRPFQIDNDSDYRYLYTGLAYSANDSFLYAIEVDTKQTPDALTYVQFSLFEEIEKHNSLPINYVFDGDLKLGPDGKIYICSINKNTLDIINKPDMYGSSMELLQNAIHLLPNLPSVARSYLGRWPNTHSHYKRVSFSAKPSCKGLSYTFTNTSDTSHFSHYRFYLGNGDSIDIPSNSALQTVSYTYPQPGKYLVHLRAFNSVGGWVYTRDSITVTAPPEAKLAVQDTVGCQWLAFTYTDSSEVLPHNQPYYTRKWFFTSATGTSMEHDTVMFNSLLNTKQRTFTKDGNYSTMLVVNNGYCSDTALLEQQVTILPAPQPGIRLSNSTGCSPLSIEFSGLHTDVVDSVVWQLGTKKWLASALSNTIKDTLIEAGSYQLLQTNYGPTGCVTADTLAIEVLEGFPLGYKPLLHTATFLEKSSDSVGVFWQAAPNAKAYQLLLNGNAVTSTQDTFYTLASPNLPALFTVEAENLCNEKAVSNLGKLIHLSVSRTEDNKAAIIQFTPYKEWPYGIAAYHIERLANGSFIKIGSLSNATPFTDADFAKGTDANQCYRIKATQQNGRWYSYSNSVCVPLAPIVWVPTAFTPNKDGLNDAFKLVAQGAKNIEYSIYNRWGELIYKGKLWDGANAPTGVYQYNAVVEFEDGQRTFLSGTVSLVR